MKNLAKGELIGLNIEIRKSKNKANVGIKGKVIDETKNMLIIKNKENKKKNIKEQNVFATKLGGKVIIMEGKDLIGTGEERIKKK